MPPHPLRLNVPSPTRRLFRRGDRELWVKDDGAIDDEYGGNKPRKLANILEHATSKGAHRLVTIGAAGSHHVLATGILGRRLGLETTALLLPRPFSCHAEQTLLRSAAAGVELLGANRLSDEVRFLHRLIQRGSFWIPPGGSNALGALGYMNAVFELEAQIQQGELPEPEVIFVALGSGGTAAGLLAGLVTSSLKSRLIAIPVVRIPAPRLLIEGLAKSALRLSKRRILRPFSQCLEMDPRWLGDGYGVSTLAGETAIKIGKKCGLFLESTYTGKTFAASLGWLSGSKDRGNVSTRSDARWASDARDSQSRVTQSALFWSTISTTKPSPSSDRAIRLSPALHSLLRNRTIT